MRSSCFILVPPEEEEEEEKQEEGSKERKKALFIGGPFMPRKKKYGDRKAQACRHLQECLKRLSNLL